MNSQAQQEIEIQTILRRIPQHRLEEVKSFLSNLAEEPPQENFSSLKGCWKGKGFEEFDDDLEWEIRQIRRQAEADLLRKKI